MPCPKCSDTLKRCPDVQSSDCIKYAGDSNTCLDFCKGQSISEVIEQLGTEACTIKENTDVSNISLLDYCPEVRNSYMSKGYTETNVKNFIDFLISFDCVLQGQINTINNNLTTFNPMVKGVIWDCLTSPCVVKGTNVSLTSAIQNLVTAYCSQQDKIESLELTICQQQKAIEALNNSITCLISTTNQLAIAVGQTTINFSGCQVSINPNPPCE